MKKYKGYLIDLDGTIYQGKKRIPAAKRFIERLQQNHIPFLFVTNNSTKMPSEVVDNLANNHDIDVEDKNVYTSGIATAAYVNDDAKANNITKSAYVIGENGLKEAMEAQGFNVFTDDPEYVVVGLDRDLTYQKLSRAVLGIAHGAKFVGTNPDARIPSENGMLPSAGSIIDSVRYASGVDPIMIGKPQTLIVEKALKQLGLKKSEVIMVGDNYDTDIMAGINDGMDTLITYTGVSTKRQVEKRDVQPTYEVNSLDEWNVL
ncbi:TIGR01457 family HAD-type hydrolase [Fructilactobacillus fructivorans]|uniref:Acid sugar phosphatase n=1 Tax=Fructilactobacillus fructivorans TaxID=1614 RepID=A0AAE6P0I3_9LACO|nr:TIGR01457 family HAD-type hydrolase [Fructilactobacillus fructivorans]KRK57889.1 HAD-superfamily subfamily IIA hydrolase like protein [Fructilactobacillus fructivorans]KRN12568.1 HAD-superfamily subfamily IIA hydrolase like protein [Fructilactobacillus fructivorans]KRN40766.1 HAD-superfamily subfamily IIA hydrolase like protein [Fructilactobacillus fructivorans]KRN41947.1 HAD-superfamily subfamily IIA hydrolase like protein [Fructilactobacillus fructivorans]QFX92841.1 TIGR01457 family HAD-t